MHRVRKMHLKLCYKAADATWVVTDSIRDAMRKAFGLSNIYTLENTIDCKEILSKASAYTPPNMTSECFYFVMVGRISHEKGYQKALRAFHQLKTDIPCKLIIVGDGPERDSLETYVRDNHLENQVVFTGFQSNPYPYIRCANAMIQPSLYESFGLTMLEAMVLRTHVITTSTIGGIRVTNNGKYGLIVDHTEEAVLRGLETALLPNAFTEEDCEQAYHWALSFDLPHFKRQLYQLLEM